MCKRGLQGEFNVDELLADPMRVSSSKGRRACFARWQLFVTLMISILVCSSTVRLDLNTISFEWRCRIAGAHVLPALACAEQVAEPVVLQAFPFTSRAFGALMKALWWHGVAHTLDSFTHVLGQMLSYGVRMRRAAAGEPPLRENALDLCDPRYVWKDLYSSFLALIRRHLDFGPNRVEPVYPAEIKAGLEGLNHSVAYQSLIGAYAAVQAYAGRRNPSLAWLRWCDVRIVKTAAVIDGTVHHMFAFAFRIVHDKVGDKHGIRVVILDPSGDKNYLEEQLLAASDHVLRLALTLGIVTEESLAACPIGENVKMEAGTDDMFVFCQVDDTNGINRMMP